MTEQLMSAPVIGKASKRSAQEVRGSGAPPLAEGNSRAERGGSIAVVLLVAMALVAAAAAILMLGGRNTEQYVMAFLAVLATVGVFSLFAFACGMLRVRAARPGDPLIKAVIDGASEAEHPESSTRSRVWRAPDSAPARFCLAMGARQE